MTIEHLCVVAGIDGSALTSAVCDYAAWISLTLNTPLKLLHTIESPSNTPLARELTGNNDSNYNAHLLEDIVDAEQRNNKLHVQKGKQLLAFALSRVQEFGITELSSLQRHDNLIDALLALEASIEILVVGVRGKDHEHQADKMGAKLDSIIRCLHKPIFVVNSDYLLPKQIMLTYDGSAVADKALTMVAQSPLFQKLTCHIVCVNSDTQVEKLLNAAKQKLSQHSNLTVMTEQLVGKPEHVLCDYQAHHNIDLTVMGVLNHEHLEEWLLGSFTLKMLTHSSHSLLLVR